jgi:cell wall-associated NlpC family hydrolase
MVPQWAYDLEGIPYADKGRSVDGADCWGVVRLAAERLGRVLPSYTESYVSAEEHEVIAALIDGERSKWERVEVEDAEVGDVLLIKTVLEGETHVGIVVGNGMMLHMRFGVRSVVETYVKGFWKNRVSEAFRYVG